MNRQNEPSGSPNLHLPPNITGGNNPSTQQSQKQKEEEAKHALILSRILSHDARDRLNRVALVKPDKVAMVQSYLLQLAQRGAIQKPIDDHELVSILSQVGGISESDHSSSLYTFVKRKPLINNDDDDELDLSQFDV